MCDKLSTESKRFLKNRIKYVRFGENRMINRFLKWLIEKKKKISCRRRQSEKIDVRNA